MRLWNDPMPTFQELEHRYELFDATPRDKMRVFDSPTLWLVSGGRAIKSWANTQPLYFYPFSVLDFVADGRKRQELRIINPDTLVAEKAIGQSMNLKVHFEGVNTRLMEIALKKGCRTSVICNLEEINEDNSSTLSSLDFLTVRADPSVFDLSTLKDIPRAWLLSGIRTYLSENDDDFAGLASEAKRVGFDFIHVSKKLMESKQARLLEAQANKVKDLRSLQSSAFRVILPRNLDMVFNEKFVISEEYGNSRNCYSSRHRKVVYKDMFHPCYTRSVIESGTFASKSIVELENKYPLFGKSCTDCACIYENDLLEDISMASKGIIDRKFLLGYPKGESAGN